MKQSRLINNIVGGSYETDERFAGCAVSQNLFAESVEDASNGHYYTTALRSVEGERIVLEDFVLKDTEGQGCRGVFTASDDSIFASFGDCIYRIRKNKANGSYHPQLIYTEPFPTIGRVVFCETGGINSHVCWVNGSSTVCAYPLSPEKAEGLGVSIPLMFSTPLRQYKTADEVMNDTNEHVAPRHICSLNGSLIIDDPKSDTWYYTDAYILGGTSYTREIYDLDKDGNVQYVKDSNYKVKTRTVKLTDFDPSSGTSYLWLDRYSKPNFNTAEYSADNITSMAVVGDRLAVFGSRSIQTYTQTISTDAQGFSSMVFSSTNSNVRDTGCTAVDSVEVVGGKAVFLGVSVSGEVAVMVSAGAEPSRISTNAIEREIEGIDVTDAFAFTYSGKGHQFYGITFPRIDKTFVYDFATRQWHNRTTNDGKGHTHAWWARYATACQGEVLVCGRGVGKVAVLDRSKYDDYLGNPIVKVRTAPVLTSDYSPFMVNDIMLLWNNGTTKDVTNENGAQNPVVMLEVSRDGGNTFEGERWAYGGKTGQYGYRTIWYGIGAGNMFVFRFTISDRVNVVITGAKISHTALSAF